LRQSFLDKEITGDVEEFVKKKLKELLAAGETAVKMNIAGPTVIMVAGVNGSGKTTSIAKLAKRFQNDQKRVIVAACDTFRAAAVEQLTISRAATRPASPTMPAKRLGHGSSTWSSLTRLAAYIPRHI
jgi:fused signal recognition particle receptor